MLMGVARWEWEQESIAARQRAEIALLARATGSATDLIATDSAVMLGMRHADAEAVVATRAVKKKQTPRTPAKGARGGAK